VQTKIALVLGQFHKIETDEMRAEAETTARECGMDVVAEVWIPGMMEAPLAVKRLICRDNIDGVVVLGIIERGKTKHGIVMAQAATHALIALQLEFMRPIGMGILGPDIIPSQIAARLRPYARAATVAVHHMLM
jgi:6,7-dimethyl-8-ribityllumazine synthase